MLFLLYNVYIKRTKKLAEISQLQGNDNGAYEQE
jgi:hypothetical protein